MATIENKHLVKKRNVLNELRANNMTLQELRFFSIYLSKINPNNVSTRIVRFTLSDFQKIMELGRININYLRQVTDGLLCKVINVPNERGGYNGFQIFKKCRVDVDDYGEWFIEIDAHDEALPLLFEFKAKYFTYQLWNALSLKSSNQLRMYEILKQYEKIGERTLTVQKLRELLGIGQDEYLRYSNFKQWVLEPCQAALSEHTDISFTFEPHGKRGAGGKILALKFIIRKNKNYIDQLTLDEFIEQADEAHPDPDAIDSDPILFYAEACNNEFDNSQIQVLYDMVVKIIPYTAPDTDRYDYFKRKYNEMEMRKPRNNRFGYLRTIIEADYIAAQDDTV